MLGKCLMTAQISHSFSASNIVILNFEKADRSSVVYEPLYERACQSMGIYKHSLGCLKIVQPTHIFFPKKEVIRIKAQILKNILKIRV